ncbi:MAG: AAA family ATPase [Ignavibacteriae bacterium]|nr:AAA family ATPase [Ignavibacteriota bacterium]
MQIKKFTSSTLKEAIAEMKQEFGVEAIVLGTKVIEDFSNGVEKKLFEITASLDEEVMVEAKKKEAPKTKSFETEMKKLTDKIYGVQQSSETFSKQKEPAKTININLDRSQFDTIKQELKDKDVSDKNIDKVIKMISQYSHLVNEDNKEEYILSILASIIPTSDFELQKNGGQKVISLVGPTGVGKTTCIAKLAVISKILHNLDIGLISIDTYRLGALDQLKIFSEISNIDFMVAYEPKDVVKFMKKFKNKDIVFIDTVGRSQNNTKLLKSINEFLKVTKVDETYLVLNSTSDYKIMLDVAKKFKVLNYNGIVFSKLDEAVTYGNLLNLVDEIKVPIKYLTNGQVIPDDIIAADSEFIANMIYTGKIN